MTTTERMLMQIFDRRRWIVEQLQQQKQSCVQSLAMNALAIGGTPPPWVFDLVPNAAACLGPKELCREQLISGILDPLPRACTPSVSRHFPLGKSVTNEYEFQPNILGGTHISTVFSFDDWDKQKYAAFVSGSQDCKTVGDMEVAESNQNWNPVFSDMLLGARMNTEHLVDTIGLLSDDTGKNIGVNRSNGSEMQLRDVSLSLNGNELSSKKLVISSGHGHKIQESSDDHKKHLDFVKSTSHQEPLNQDEKDAPKMVPASQTDFLDRKWINDADFGAQHPLENNVPSELQQITDNYDSENVQTVHLLSGSKVPSGRNSDGVPLKSRYFLRSSSEKEKKIGHTNSNSSPVHSYEKAQDSTKISNKHFGFFTSTSESNPQSPIVFEENNLLRVAPLETDFLNQKSFIRDEKLDDSGTECAIKFNMSSKPLQNGCNGDAADDQILGLHSEAGVTTNTGSDKKSSKSGYFLRSSLAIEKKVGSTILISTPKYCSEVDESSKCTQKQFDVVEPTQKSAQHLLEQLENDSMPNISARQAKLSNRRSHDGVSNGASSCKSDLRIYISPEVRQVSRLPVTEDPRSEVSGSATVSSNSTVSNNKSLKSNYLPKSSSTQEKGVGSINPSSYPEIGIEVKQSSPTSKNWHDFAEPNFISSHQLPKQLKNGHQNLPVNQTIFSIQNCDKLCGTVAYSRTSCPTGITMSPDVPQIREASHMVDIQKVVPLSENAVDNSIESDGKPSKSHYFLRSSSGGQKRVGPFAKSLNKLDSGACELTWPKRRKRERQSDNINGTPNKRLRHSDLGGCTGITNSEHASADIVKCLPLSVSNLFPSKFPHVPLEVPSEGIIQDASLSFGGSKQRRESTDGSPIYRSSGDGEPSLHLKNISEHLISDVSCSCEEVTETMIAQNPHIHLDSSYECFDNLYLEKLGTNFTSESMPEYEGFNIGDSEIGDDHVTVTNLSSYRISIDGKGSVNEEPYFRKALTPLPNLSMKHKIGMLPFGKVNVSSSLHGSSDSECMRSPWEDGKNAEICEWTEGDGSLLERPKSVGIFAASFPSDCDAKKVFTPFVKTTYQKVIPDRTVDSSNRFSSPELCCFPIDENASMHGDEFVAEETNTLSGQLVATNSKPLTNRTSFHENTLTMASTPEKFHDRASLDSVSTEACFQFQGREKQSLDTQGSSLKSNTINKENLNLSAAGVKAHNFKSSLKRPKPSKPKLFAKSKDQNKVNTAAEKGNKPTNIVSNLSSFIPLLPQKQQPGKREIKLKSLEAAEAARHREEKKERERQLKKEAIRLERLRIEQENIKQLEVEQKQKEEERRRKEIETEARKRQREEDEKKERQRKRRCVDEMQHRRQIDDKLNAEKRDTRSKATKESVRKDAKKEVPRQNLVKESEVAESKKSLEVNKWDDRMGWQDKCKAMGNDAYQKKDVPSIPEKDLQGKNFVNKVHRESQLYELSPYHDSDDEDEDVNRQKRKIVPSWARRESVDRVLYIHKHTDPADIFKRKKSCSLDEVLSVPVRVRRLPFAPQ